MFVADLIIHSAERLILIDLGYGSECNLSARSGRGRQLLDDRERLRTEESDRHLVVWKLRACRGIDGLGKSTTAEIAGEHACRRNKTGPVGGIGSCLCALITGEKEHTIFLDRAADGAAVLIT